MSEAKDIYGFSVKCNIGSVAFYVRSDGGFSVIPRPHGEKIIVPPDQTESLMKMISGWADRHSK